MPYRNDKREATKDATPQTMIVAVVSFAPVPPLDPVMVMMSRMSREGRQVLCLRS
jgi:hypothetical protein